MYSWAKQVPPPIEGLTENQCIYKNINKHDCVLQTAKKHIREEDIHDTCALCDVNFLDAKTSEILFTRLLLPEPFVPINKMVVVFGTL